MRKTMALAVAGALILALGTAGLAQAVNSHQTVAVKLAQSKAGTAAKPKSVGELTVDMKVALDPSDPSFATRSAVIHFDKGLVFNSREVPQLHRGAGPPRRRRLRQGQDRLRQGRGPGARPAEDLAVTAYNAPAARHPAARHRSPSAEHRQRHRGPAQARQRRLRPQARRRHPGQPPAAARRRLRHADLLRDKVGGSAKGTPYVALKGCSGGKLKFKGDFVFTDGSKQSPTSTTACKK